MSDMVSSLSHPTVERSKERPGRSEQTGEARRASAALSPTFASGRVLESPEVRGRLVVQRRVEPAGVVEALDEADDISPGLGHCRKTTAVEKLALEGLPGDYPVLQYRPLA